ncbi:porphobilinogen deaminase, dipyromethane cofactor binding domain-containing protein [Polychytrium aggregatum]|uniref:porphobilinogen deaminase, dipyromethane cofactor binding domain-containing protein n=1 Tax=Polychytrium aggregatum TaxID=110093 RepID=UPI0022FE2D4F|nr:porphobilinogen deaminase, dipyromethane cofactor binding domain-containing protein [Polychytrium aggregatum]KAI9203217.1 porphobilinogen deaminase, dipyromethane cofactor binding domain-containing protein [Polychytrium aggregatum]
MPLTFWASRQTQRPIWQLKERRAGTVGGGMWMAWLQPCCSAPPNAQPQSRNSIGSRPAGRGEPGRRPLLPCCFLAAQSVSAPLGPLPLRLPPRRPRPRKKRSPFKAPSLGRALISACIRTSVSPQNPASSLPIAMSDHPDRANPFSIVLGTRESQLAMWQTKHVLGLLQQHHPETDFTIKGMTTTGDQILNVALNKVGTKALFTKELEVALELGEVDLIVHSLKDVPTTLPEGMVLGATVEREDPRDVVIMAPKWVEQGILRLEDLPKGSVLGTSSVRRTAQLKRRFPGLLFHDIRGNLNTRFAKLDAPDSPYDAILLAYAGVHRLEWDHRISQILEPEQMQHAVGQGAIGIEIREGDAKIQTYLECLNHKPTQLRTFCERAFMRRLEGGCSVPLGVWTELRPKEQGSAVQVLKFVGSVCALDGSDEIVSELEVELGGEDHQHHLELAQGLGLQLADSLIEKGARVILDSIKVHNK